MTEDISKSYEKSADLLQGIFSNKLFRNDMVLPHWIDGSHCFWYIRQTKKGREFRFVNAESATNKVAFDHLALSKSLSKLSGKNFDHENLSLLKDVKFSIFPITVYFKAVDKHWMFNVHDNECYEVEPEQEFVVKEGYDFSAGFDVTHTQKGLESPDGKKAIFVRDYNLFMVDLMTGKERVLTEDGSEDNRYAQSLYTSSDSSVHAVWSPDSKRIMTLQLDTRNVRARSSIQYIPRDGSLYPQVEENKDFSYPGDALQPVNRLLTIDISTGKSIFADYRPLEYCGVGTGIFSEKSRHFAWWSNDSINAYFIDMARGSKTASVIKLDTRSGSTRLVFKESSETFIRLCYFLDEGPMFLPIPETSEFIWFSEESGWGHLYLYDLNTGEKKRAITQGDWLVRNVLHFDSKRRELLIQTAARDTNISPYYRDVCKVNIDTGNIVELAGGNFEHSVYQKVNPTNVRRALFGLDYSGAHAVSSGGDYVVLTRSRVDSIPESVLIDRDGNEILLLETTDISDLPSDWVWPESVKMKAADGTTDIYGVIYHPPNYSKGKKYPVIDISGGYRWYTIVPQGSFGNAQLYEMYYLIAMALTQLGFVVVAMEGRGTPCRNKDFSNYRYGEPSGCSDFNDRIYGLRQLADRFSHMDLNSVGVCSADAPANTVFALLDHPDFYKVAVIHCHCDPRFWISEVAESYDGVSINGQITSARHAEDSVSAMKGKLLLIDGMLNPNTPSSTFRLIQALEKANKDYDLILSPKGIMDVTSYGLRREWDYFVTHLKQEKPPEQFELITGLDVQSRLRESNS
jgi:dipeptidyl-peptidase-4